jgi:hypothetical protein
MILKVTAEHNSGLCGHCNNDRKIEDYAAENERFREETPSADDIDVYSYRFPDDYPEEVIGVYEADTGDLPHLLMGRPLKAGWRPPIISFDIDLADIDPIPSTNLPLPLVQNNLGIDIWALAREEMTLIPVKVIANGNQSDSFSILHPSRSVQIWDLERSTWEGMGTENRKAEKPMFMRNMLLKRNLELPNAIAFNSDWPGMVVFNKEVADLIVSSGSWVQVFRPQGYNNA